MRVDDFLAEQRVPFQRLQHRPAYTANRVAQMLHVPGKEVAKTVLLRTASGYMLVVLPATHRIDLERLQTEATTTLEFPRARLNEFVKAANEAGVSKDAGVSITTESVTISLPTAQATKVQALFTGSDVKVTVA